MCLCPHTVDEEYPYAEYHYGECPAKSAVGGQTIIHNTQEWEYYFGHVIKPPANVVQTFNRKGSHSKYYPPAGSDGHGPETFLRTYFKSWRYDRDKFQAYWKGTPNYFMGVNADEISPHPLLIAAWLTFVDWWKRHA